MTRDGDVCTLQVTGVTQKMTGIYKCVATNTAGTAECPAQVTVTEKMEPPKLTIKPKNKDVKEPTKASFGATATGKPLPDLTWYKGEEPLEPQDRVTITTTDDKSGRSTSLVFEPTTVDDTCELTVVAKNPAGEDSAKAKLTVQSKSPCSLLVFWKLF